MLKVDAKCYLIIKLGIVLYFCVFLLQFVSKDSFNPVTDDLKDDVNGNPGYNVKGYYYATLQTSRINKLKPEINIRSIIPSRVTPAKSMFSTDLAPFLVIVVCSHPSHVQRRLTIRNTWGYNLAKEVGVVFLIGDARETSWKSIIRRENVIHGDIMHVNVTESYTNLTEKMISGFLEIVNKYPSAQYVLKADDDVYINVPYILGETTVNSNFLNHSQIMGALCKNSKVIRDPRDIWFVSSTSYPSQTYPPYVAGGAYIMRYSTLKKLISVANVTAYLHLEDVYITGILAQKTVVAPISHSGFSFWKSKSASACDFVTNKRISSVNMADKQIKNLHTEIQHRLITGCL